MVIVLCNLVIVGNLIIVAEKVSKCYILGKLSSSEVAATTMKHAEGTFRGYQDFDLYYQSWIPETTPRAILLIVHGLADHSGRFTNLAGHFVSNNYLVCALDQRGHGRSPGKKGHIESFSYFVQDLDRFLEFIRRKHPGLKIFIIAHSVGGTVATAYSVQHRDGYSGLILSGPTLKAGDSVPRGLMLIAPLLSGLIPRVGLYTIDSSAISRDASVVAAYQNDPLVYRAKISTRLGIEILKTMDNLKGQFSKIEKPLLILHGGVDRLSNPAGSRELYNKASSRDKTLKFYPGLYHEIFNEPEHDQVFEDMEKWLDGRL